eukprot:SAG11_NODE_3250_length_2581_cov_12.899678_1_plen_78_part_00
MIVAECKVPGWIGQVLGGKVCQIQMLKTLSADPFVLMLHFLKCASRLTIRNCDAKKNQLFGTNNRANKYSPIPGRLQ